MKKEKRIEIMASTYDIATLIASLHGKIELTLEEGDSIMSTVSGWQSWMTEKLELSVKEAVEAYKICETYDKNVYKMSIEAVKADADIKNTGEA